MGTVNPLAGIPVADYARDVAATFLLLVSLTMPWDYSTDATGHIGVVLATLASVGSLSLLYLPRLGVLPPTWKAANTRMLRIVLNLPYGVAVLITIVQDVSSGPAGNGVGMAVAFGLAGAVLAASPRQAELDDAAASSGREAHRWRAAVGVLGALPSVLTALSVLILLAELSEFGAPGSVIFTLIAVAAIAPAIVTVPAVCAAVKRDASWLAVTAGIGVAMAALGVWINADDGGRAVESIHAFSWGVAFWLVSGAAAAAAPTMRAMADQPRHLIWIHAAARLFTLSIMTTTLLLVIIVSLLAELEPVRGALTGAAVLMVVVLVGALVARAVLVRADRQGRAVALAVCAGYATLGVVALATNPDIMEERGLDVFTVLITFGFPVIVALMLTVPPSVRAYYNSLPVTWPAGNR